MRMNLFNISPICHNTATTLSQHCHNTVTTLSQHCRNTVTTLPQHCHNTATTLSQPKTCDFSVQTFLRVLKCYNFLRVQRHNCSPAASSANCVMTLHLLTVHLQTFLSIPITQKCQILSCDTLVVNERYNFKKKTCVYQTALSSTFDQQFHNLAHLRTQTQMCGLLFKQRVCLCVYYLELQCLRDHEF